MRSVEPGHPKEAAGIDIETESNSSGHYRSW